MWIHDAFNPGDVSVLAGGFLHKNGSCFLGAETAEVSAQVYVGGMTAVLRRGRVEVCGVSSYFILRTDVLAGDVGNIAFLADDTGDTGLAFLAHTCCLLGETISALPGDCDANV
jgi:hypothetical protein